KLMGMPSEQPDEFSEMELSALKEIGNIITGAYLNSLATLTNLTIFPSIPDVCIDMAGAILSVPAIEFGTIADKLLLIETDFTDDEDMSGFFILVPDAESYGKILKALGVM
ncbi:MAG: chemotaxis protein CheC, partial [Lachnospiraceae bacterium]|nr:chemotaxis protein CheC [Lachnospiraceae bacterium]MCR5597337.1 chemotaxis protein CheC [Lachnospiraceae bacterium]